MYTNDTAACRTGPSLPLLLQKGIHAVLLNHLQVLDHAHMVLCSISLIQLFHPQAREPLAVILLPLVCITEPAVHTAGGNKI